MGAIVLTTVVLLWMTPPLFSQQETSEGTRSDAAISCGTSCRGLGIEKVKAGDEHCGFLTQERKEKALDMACSLSVDNQDDLQRLAKEN